jgi:hypothetical protein
VVGALEGRRVTQLLIALTIGFILGILLMIFLVMGREEEELVQRVEEDESSRRGSSRVSGRVKDPGGQEAAPRIPSGES